MPNLMYRPWSSANLLECQIEYRQNKLPILDLELTGICSHGTCIYCDSKTGQLSNELSWSEVEALVNQAYSLGSKWIFICGLGEPLDSPWFINLIALIKELGINLSFFTNGLKLSKNIAITLKNTNANLILKLDSFNAKIFDTLLGKKGSARIIYEKLDMLLEIGFSQCNRDKLQTNLALSIVPTKLNCEEIPELVSYCMENDLFPSIGELEFAGRGRKKFDMLALTAIELDKLRLRVDKIWGEKYCRPVCPSVFFSLHITPNGFCVVDESTGLSCPWFKLTDPRFSILGNIRDDRLSNLIVRSSSYRIAHLNGLHSLSPIVNVPSVFSGCGGKLQEIKEYAIDLIDQV